ncbi:proline-rich protein 2-like [Passer domesticus]|uniref:proline-rich protein 2-like n=1 Tax=Passer domesticus TaxID=48849 RepID=UPI0030FE3CD2
MDRQSLETRADRLCQPPPEPPRSPSPGDSKGRSSPGKELTEPRGRAVYRQSPLQLPGGTHGRTLTGSARGARPRAAGPGQPAARRARQPRHGPAHSGKRNPLPVRAGPRPGGREPLPPRIRCRPGRARLTPRTDTSPPSRRPQQPPPPPGATEARHKWASVPQFLSSTTEERSRQGRCPPRPAPEPRPQRHPRANRSQTEPGTCSPPPPRLAGRHGASTGPPPPAPRPRCRCSTGQPGWRGHSQGPVAPR